jgi:hypothetical protein
MKKILIGVLLFGGLLGCELPKAKALGFRGPRRPLIGRDGMNANPRSLGGAANRGGRLAQAAFRSLLDHEL